MSIAEKAGTLGAHATLTERRALANEYRKFDARALSVTGLPVVVSYRCVAAEPGRRQLSPLLTGLAADHGGTMVPVTWVGTVLEFRTLREDKAH